MVLPPSGPPPPSLPEGWKAHWNAEYKAWFYENIYTEESVWEKPSAPVYPQGRAPLPAGPPPGYSSVQQPVTDDRSTALGTLPDNMAGTSLTDGKSYNQSQQELPPLQQQYNPSPPPNANSPQPNPQSLYSATPQPARAPSPHAPAPALNAVDQTRDYNPQAALYATQPTYPGYPPQQQSPAPVPGYPPQQQYAAQPNYAPQAQQQFAQPPPGQQAPPPKAGGFMGMLQDKVGSKVPGGAGTVLGIGGGLLAGAVLEHEWDKHEDREKRRHHGGFGGLGGLMRGFGGPPVVENVTINEDVYVDQNYNSTFGF